MRFRVLAVCITCVLVFSVSRTHAQTITYTDTGDGIERPVLILGITVKGIQYDVTVTYNNDGHDNPLRVSVLPDTDIDDAALAIRVALNDRDPDDTYDDENSIATAILFQPNTDTEVLDPEGFQWNAEVYDTTVGEDNWQYDTTIQTTDFGANYLEPYYGFAQFTVVPEPGTCALGLSAVLSMVGLGWYRRRRSNHPSKPADT